MAFLAISSSRELARVPLGPYVGILLDDVESPGFIQYGHVLEVIDPRAGERVFAVAAERNQLAGTGLGGGSHFICGYDGGSHLNYGSSDDYADRDKFLARAVELVREHLQLPVEEASEGKMVVERPAGRASDTDAGELVVSTSPTPDAGELVVSAARQSDADELVVTQPASSQSDADELVVTQPASSQPKPGGVAVTGPAGPTPEGVSLVAGMRLTLVGAALVTLSLLLTVAMMRGMVTFEVPLRGLILPAGLVLFAFGCFQSAEGCTGLASLWVRRAGILGGVAAGLAVIKFASGMILEGEDLGVPFWRISTPGVFMLALACHAAFLIHLAEGMGLGFQVGPALKLLWLWVLLAAARFYVNWVNYGETSFLVEAATLLGLVIWGIFHITMTARARRA